MALYSAMAVANYIIDLCSKMENPISNLRLQKMLYFAWVDYYRETGHYLFYDPMYAWQLGPVVPEVYYEYCPYGGRPINLMCESEIKPKDEEILKDIVEKYKLVPVSELVERTHKPETAWSKVYNGGEGNKKVIPFDLIKKKEFGEDNVS